MASIRGAIMKTLRALCLLAVLGFTGCGNVQSPVSGDPDAAGPPADDVDAPVGPGTPDAAIGPPPDAAIGPPPDAAPDAEPPPPPECTEDSACGAGAFCVDLHCVECRDDSTCPASAPVCGPAHACVAACTTDAACSAFTDTPFCGPAGGCVACENDNQCGEPGLSECVDNVCVECGANNDCTAGEPVCGADHTCTAACATDAQCSAYPDTPYCGPSGGCVTCETDAQCGEPGLSQCVANVCVECGGDSDCSADAPVCGADNTCGACTVNADCAGYPGTPVCGPAGTCVECRTDAQCDTPGLSQCVANVCEECDGASTCSIDEPVCRPATHTCDGCAADADCALYPGAPVCGDDGGCVECESSSDCGGTTPVCEATECRACTSGSECASGECHLDTGACYAPTELIYLSPTGNDTLPCTKTQKCATLARALQLVTTTKYTISLATGTYALGDAQGSLVIPETLPRVVILGHLSILSGGLDIKTSTTIRDASIIGDATHPIYCKGSGVRCELERVSTNAPITAGSELRLVDFSSSNYVIASKLLYMRRGRFVGASGSVTLLGLQPTTGWDIANSTFARNATPVSFRGAGDPALPHRFENNTLVDNSPGGSNNALDLSCSSGAAGVFRNNLVWRTSPSIGGGVSVSGECPMTYSMVYTGTSAPFPGTGNILGNPEFVRPVPVGSLPVDYHLLPDSQAIDRADPANAIAEDMDRQARPHGPRADIGADEYVP
jgi:hypothetical protein